MNQYPIFIGFVVAFVMVCLTSNPLWWMVSVIGMGANGLVCAGNGWRMPVRGMHVDKESLTHCRMSKRTRYKLLADIIPTGFGKASIGDFFLVAGILGIVASGQSFSYAKITLLIGLWWWASGWARGFNLFEKWKAQARRAAFKKIPIVVLLIALGNMFNLHGCSLGAIHAAAKGVAEAITPEVKPLKPSKPQSRWRDLGTIVAPPPQMLRRLRETTAKQIAQENREAALKAVAQINQNQNGIFILTATAKPKSARTGPFCRVTCAAHHGGLYDVETVPELCRANWIPEKAEIVPGWYATSPKEELTYSWPGPAQSGFENYKLYWSDVQSEAKMLHLSRIETASAK